MVQEVPMTREEKLEMYMARPKEEIAAMLVNCNEALARAVAANSPRTSRRDGGQAFPMANREGVPNVMGMSLRDYFAGQALVGEINIQVEMAKAGIATTDNPVTDIARIAYEVADAMLAERERES